MTDQRSILFERHRTRINDLLPTYPTFDRAARDLNDAAPTFTAAIERLELGLADGLGAQSFDGTPGGSDSSSIPERMAIAERGDPAADTLTELDRMLRYLGENLRRPSVASVRLAANARTIWLIVHAWSPHKATEKQKAVVERLNNLDPECLHCRTGSDRHEPYRTITDVGGLLAAPVPLCRWHTDFTAKNERPATANETDRHHQGRTIRLPVKETTT